MVKIDPPGAGAEGHAHFEEVGVVALGLASGSLREEVAVTRGRFVFSAFYVVTFLLELI